MFDLKDKSYNELNINELYAIMALRQEVFVVEQNCIYKDLDGLDQKGRHFMILDPQTKIIVAYARVFAPGIIYPDSVSIGRVVVEERFRKNGLGKRIMENSIRYSKEMFPKVPIKISAQTYLSGFYSELGFQEIGEHYLEDGIPHMAMILKNK